MATDDDMVIYATFTSDKIYAQWKKKSYSISEFFSFVGGLLGLFAGFSVLSGAEVLYYLIVHPIIQLKHRSDLRVYPFDESVQREFKNSKIVGYIKDMLENSSIHSFGQIGMSGKSFIERLEKF